MDEFKQITFNRLSILELEDLFFNKLFNITETSPFIITDFFNGSQLDQSFLVIPELDKMAFDDDYFQSTVLPAINKCLQSKQFVGNINIIDLFVYACKFDIIPEGNYIIYLNDDYVEDDEEDEQD